MTEEQAKQIIDSMSVYIDSTYFDKEDKDTAWAWINILLAVLITFDFPTTDSRFPEVLRTVANALELGCQIENKK
jgi:hypothetical protein